MSPHTIHTHPNADVPTYQGHFREVSQSKRVLAISFASLRESLSICGRLLDVCKHIPGTCSIGTSRSFLMHFGQSNLLNYTVCNKTSLAIGLWLKLTFFILRYEMIRGSFVLGSVRLEQNNRMRPEQQTKSTVGPFAWVGKRMCCWMPKLSRQDAKSLSERIINIVHMNISHPTIFYLMKG